MCQNRALVPPFEGATAHFHVVNFNALFDILSDILEESFFRLQLIEHSVNQVYAQDANGLLLEDARSIPHVDVENYLVRFSARLQLESQPHPAVRLICSSVVEGGDGIDKGKEASVRSAAFIELVKELGPLTIQHSFKAFSGNVTCTGTVQIVADFLVIRRDRFGNCPGGSSYDQEPSHDFLASTNFGKGAVAGRIKVDVERFLMNVELFHGCHRATLSLSPRKVHRWLLMIRS